MIEGLTRDDDHVYRFCGQVVPGVTSIMKPLFDWSGIPEAVLERKSAIGRAVHLACQLIDEGNELDPESIDPAVQPYVDAYRSFLASARPVVLDNESFVFHGVYRYAGQLDRRYSIQGDTWWVDIKTTASTSPATGVQLAAYMKAHEFPAQATDRRATLWLKPEGTWQLVKPETKLEDDWRIFLSLLNLHHWKQKHVR